MDQMSWAASLEVGMRVQLEISTRTLGLTLNLLRERKLSGVTEAGKRTTEWVTHSAVKLNDGYIKHEVAVAIAFGGEGKSKVRLPRFAPPRVSGGPLRILGVVGRRACAYVLVLGHGHGCCI